MTDLYEAGDINQSDGAGGDINEVDEIDEREIDESTNRERRVSARATSSAQPTGAPR